MRLVDTSIFEPWRKRFSSFLLLGFQGFQVAVQLPAGLIFWCSSISRVLTSNWSKSLLFLNWLELVFNPSDGGVEGLRIPCGTPQSISQRLFLLFGELIEIGIDASLAGMRR